MNITDILCKYTSGDATLKETNKALKAAGAPFHLNPAKNTLTAEEIANGTAGLLGSGTGSLDKVYIENGHLINADCGVMKAYVVIGGKSYEVNGTEIIGL